ncbi:uncharacterized protein LOC143371545 [Andrena cerasifolii]|uniref:uncharacterized protein LOC143371545 n=1 Tax=Andrena cerasifolii TaxID=2819439 RepID=UPI004037A3EC
MELKLLLTAHLATTILASILQNELNRNDQQLDSTLKQVIATVAETWPTHDVTVISHDNRSDSRVAQIADTISQTVSPLYPTCCYQTANLSSLKVNGHAAATSRSLVLFIYGARVAPTAKEAAKIVQSVVHVSHTKHVPRILLILALDNNKSSIKLCLKGLWEVGYRRVVGVQVPSTSAGNKPLPPVIVHRYNPFVPSNYTRSTYNGDVSNWYVDQQLGGLELKLCRFNSTSKAQSELLETQLLVLKEKLNASFAIVYMNGIKARCDMTYNLFYLLHNRFYNTGRDHTAPIYMDRFCLFAPTMVQRASETMSWGLTVAFLVGVLIVGIVLGFSRLIDAATFGRPFNVIAVILGVCLDSLRLPTGAEKVLYLCLVQVATRYTTMLYTEMFSETAMGQREVKINEFEDLYGLNLTIRVSRSLYRFFGDENNSIVPADLMPMFQLEQYPQENDDNVGYFSMQVLEIFQQQLYKYSRNKRTNLCFGSVSVVHMVPPKWPYKDPVDDLLLRINQYGFRGHANSWNTKGTGYRDDEQGVVDSPSAQRRMVTALLYGYLLVLVVFVGELVVWWIRVKIGAGGVAERPGDFTQGRRVTVARAFRALE